MVIHALTRRSLIAGLTLGMVARGATAEDVIELDWEDLLPKAEAGLAARLRGIIEHGDPGHDQSASRSSDVRTDWNGAIVRLSGFALPLDMEGSGVTLFLLVPYVGACVHVPPPPPNQLVLVSTQTPYTFDSLFSPVTVMGMFGTSATSTQLADIGYALSADDIQPFQ